MSVITGQGDTFTAQCVSIRLQQIEKISSSNYHFWQRELAAGRDFTRSDLSSMRMSAWTMRNQDDAKALLELVDVVRQQLVDKGEL